MMKKGRPGVMLSVLCPEADREATARRVLHLTGGFGVRYRTWDRTVLNRRFAEVDTPLGPVTVKVGSLDGATVAVQPEFESVRQLAGAAGVPVREAMQHADAAAAAFRRGGRVKHDAAPTVDAVLAQTGSVVPPTALFIAGVILITAWLFMRMRKRRIEGPGHPTAREQLERYRQHDGVKHDLEGLMVDIEQLAKRLGAQLDAKALRLEKLIDDADLRISQLQAPSNVAAPPPGAPLPAPSGSSPISTNTLTPDPLTADVYRLADEGLPPPAIAGRLDEHVGKVELILALRRA